MPRFMSTWQPVDNKESPQDLDLDEGLTGA